MSIKNVTEIISLAALMLGNEATVSRGAKLASDLANILLEEILEEKLLQDLPTTSISELYPEAKPPAPVVEKPAPAPTPAPKPAAPAPTPAATMTPEELNNALVVEFRRLGSREAIDNAMDELGVTSVNDLKPEQYNVLLTKVQGIK